MRVRAYKKRNSGNQPLGGGGEKGGGLESQLANLTLNFVYYYNLLYEHNFITMNTGTFNLISSSYTILMSLLLKQPS